MFFKKKPLAVKNKVKAPLSAKQERHVYLVHEAWWLSLVILGIFLSIILMSYHPEDSSWSHIATAGVDVQNLGGKVGAWISDMLLYLFGFSAWWLVIFAFYAAWLMYHQIDEKEKERPFLIFNIAGFVLLIAASSAMEAGHIIDLPASLPDEQGGIVGHSLDDFFRSFLGYVSTSMLLSLLAAVGFSFFSGWSWLMMVEKFGAGLIFIYQWMVDKYHDWQDRKVGKVVGEERSQYVEHERKRTEDRSPLKIKPAKTKIEKSERVLKEKQVSLFASDPDSALPPLHLLDEANNTVELPSDETLEFTSRLIERKLQDFGIEVKVLSAEPGPVITRYELDPAAGVKGSQITNLARDLARALSVMSVRVVETIPGKSYMGLEIPNPNRQMVFLTEIMGSKVYGDMNSPLAIALGKDIAGEPVVADLAKMPHVLVAGTTGSGKSVAINALILSLLYKADANEVRMILIDPKMLELSVYEGIPHLLAPVVTDMRQAGNALNWCVAEMERRYKFMSALGVRNLAGYNQKIKDAEKRGEKIPHPFSLTPEDPEPLEELPTIVVVIDELADMMMVVGKKVEELIARLAQKARACGIHLVLATQRPSVDVITGLIKANVPTRISFQVSSKIDSRTILDQMGAEALLGQGDMLYMPPGSGYPQRIHGAFVSDREVHAVVNHLKELGEPNYIEGILDNATEGSAAEAGGYSDGGGEKDELYDEAVAIVLKTRRASISSVQRQLRIGYNRAARLIEDMEQAGLVSEMQTNGSREVLVKAEEE